MSKKGQISILLGFVILCVGYVLKTLTGFSVPYFEEFLWLVFSVLVAFALFFDREFLIDFLKMKTTKNGLNMGVIILLMVVLVVAVNYIGFKNNKKWDLTSEKLNSLSEQTVQILKTLDKEVKIIGFFDGNHVQFKTMLLDVAEKMKFESKFVVVEVYEPTKRPDLKKLYNITASGDLVVSYDGKQKVISALTFLSPEEAEQTIINQIYSLKQSESKVIYFTTGHGELNLESVSSSELDPNSVSKLKGQMENIGYSVRSLNLLEMSEMPIDAAIIAIVRPKVPLADKEFDIIKNFLKAGGNLILAADPGEKHSIQKLTELLGVNFKNNYIFDAASQAPFVVYGANYPSKKISGKSAEIMTLYVVASELDFKAIPGISHDVLVKSSKESFVTNSLKVENSAISAENLSSMNIGILAEGTLEGSEKNFKAMVFGDSDFMNDDLFERSPGNRDFILNAFAYLTNQQELISIRPKNLKLNPFVITPTKINLFFYGVILPVPIFLFIFSLVLGYRRRHA